MIYKKLIGLRPDRSNTIKIPSTGLICQQPQDLDNLARNIALVPAYFLETLSLDSNFKPLSAPDKKIYITGSGASSLQAQFLAELLYKYVGISATFVPPFSLTIDSKPKAGETVIFFSQKLSSSTKAQIEYYRSIGIKVVVFTARLADGLPDDVQKYKFLPQHSFRGGEKTIMPVIGPISSYLLIIRYISYLMHYYGIVDPDFPGIHRFHETYNKILMAEHKFDKQEKFSHLDDDPQIGERPIVIIASGLNMTPAQHIALALTEGALMDVHAYEMENYTHGLRFFDRDKPRTFIVLKNLSNKPYYQKVYPSSVFTEDHHVLEFFSSLPEPLRIFEYMMMSFHLLQYLIKLKKISIRNYPGKKDPNARSIHGIKF